MFFNIKIPTSSFIKYNYEKLGDLKYPNIDTSNIILKYHSFSILSDLTIDIDFCYESICGSELCKCAHDCPICEYVYKRKALDELMNHFEIICPNNGLFDEDSIFVDENYVVLRINTSYKFGIHENPSKINSICQHNKIPIEIY